MSPFKGLLASRKFWLMVLDVIVSGATFFIGKYAGADGQDMLFVIGLLQPVFVTVIASVTLEDNAERKLIASKHEAELSWQYFKDKKESEEA